MCVVCTVRSGSAKEVCALQVLLVLYLFYFLNILSLKVEVLRYDIFNYYVICLSPLVCDVEIVTCIGLAFAVKATSFAFMLLLGTFSLSCKSTEGMIFMPLNAQPGNEHLMHFYNYQTKGVNI